MSYKNTIAIVYDKPEYVSKKLGNYNLNIEAISDENILIFKDLLKEEGYKVKLIPSTKELAHILSSKNITDFCCAINLSAGTGGNHRSIEGASILEMLDVPYSGNDPSVLSICRNKNWAKNIVENNGVLVPPGIIVNNESLELIDSISDSVFPVIVKPVNDGDSLGISGEYYATHLDLFCAARNLVKLFPNGLLIEKLIKGIEISVFLIGNDDLTIFPLVLLKNNTFTPEDFIFSYALKKEIKTSKILSWDFISNRLESEICENITEQSLKIFRTLGLRDYGRIDFRLSKSNELYFIECNGSPDITPNTTNAKYINTHYYKKENMLQKLFLDESIKRMRLC